MDDNTNWTSFDLYYKGFHVKKSFPTDYKLEDIIKAIKKAQDLGFEPSWNKETSKEQLKVEDPIMEATKDELGNCNKCGAPNKLSKAGKPYCGKVCWKD